MEEVVVVEVMRNKPRLLVRQHLTKLLLAKCQPTDPMLLLNPEVKVNHSPPSDQFLQKAPSLHPPIQ